jgi:hypothetical protein
MSMQEHKADPNAVDRYRRSSLHVIGGITTVPNAGRIIPRLVGAGGDLAAPDVNGEPPLRHFIVHAGGNAEAVAAALAAGADPNMGTVPGAGHVHPTLDGLRRLMRRLSEVTGMDGLP